MPVLNRGNYQNNEKRRKLTVEDMGGHKYAVLTVGAVVVDNIPDSTRTSGFRETVRIETREFGDEAWYYPNYAGVQAMIEQYGEDTDGWAGRPLVLVATTTKHPVTKRDQPALHVAPVAEWEDIIHANVRDEDRESEPTTTTTRKTSARKGAGSRGAKR